MYMYIYIYHNLTVGQRVDVTKNLPFIGDVPAMPLVVSVGLSNTRVVSKKTDAKNRPILSEILISEKSFLK